MELMTIMLYGFLFLIGIWTLILLAGSSTQNYCRSLREPMGDDEDDK